MQIEQLSIDNANAHNQCLLFVIKGSIHVWGVSESIVRDGVVKTGAEVVGGCGHIPNRVPRHCHTTATLWRHAERRRTTYEKIIGTICFKIYVKNTTEPQ